MSLSPKASQAAAEYLAELAREFAPDLVEEFRDQIIELDADQADRSKDLFALIENHDVANEPRTMENFLAQLRQEDGSGGDPASPTDEAEGTAPAGSGDKDPKGKTMTDDEKIPAGRGAAAEGDQESKGPYKLGDYVRFAHGEGEHEVHGEGEIVAVGDSGVRIRTTVGKEEREHTVHHGKLRGKATKPVKKALGPLIFFGAPVRKAAGAAAPLMVFPTAPAPAPEPAAAPAEEPATADPRISYTRRVILALRNLTPWARS